MGLVTQTSQPGNKLGPEKASNQSPCSPTVSVNRAQCTYTFYLKNHDYLATWMQHCCLSQLMISAMCWLWCILFIFFMSLHYDNQPMSFASRQGTPLILNSKCHHQLAILHCC